VKDERTKKDEYQKALTAYADAIKEFRREKFEKAIEMLKAFLERHPAEKELADRARIYIAISEGRLKGKGDPISLKTAEDHYQYGIYKMNAGEYDESVKLFEKAAKLDPESGKVHYALADVSCLMGQAEESLEHLKKAVQVDKSFRVLAQNEPDFEPLWEDKKFKLITRIS
jgi:tetratricopeptide (TPR) repeat protein